MNDLFKEILENPRKMLKVKAYLSCKLKHEGVVQFSMCALPRDLYFWNTNMLLVDGRTCVFYSVPLSVLTVLLLFQEYSLVKRRAILSLITSMRKRMGGAGPFDAFPGLSSLPRFCSFST